MLQEKKKNEEEVEELEGLVRTSEARQEKGPEECHACMNIYSVSNHIGKSNLELALHKELISFEQMIIMHNLKEKPLLDNLIQKIHDIVKEVYPDSKVSGRLTQAHIYGSYATGLCLPWSDIDILLEFNSSYPSDDYLQAIDFHLSDKHSDIIKSKKYIKTANYPVLKLECTPEYANKRLDITVKEVRHSGLSCVGLVREYLKEYEGILRPLVYVLKQILFLANLNDPFTGGVNSYALVLMVVAFIQAEIKNMPLMHLESKPQISQNLGAFFLRFLNTYGNEVDINIREVRPSRTTDFLSEDQFPLKTESSAVNQLILRDPLMWTNNVTRSSFNFYIVRVKLVLKLDDIQLLIFLGIPAVRLRDQPADEQPAAPVGELIAGGHLQQEDQELGEPGDGADADHPQQDPQLL